MSCGDSYRSIRETDEHEFYIPLELGRRLELERDAARLCIEGLDVAQLAASVELRDLRQQLEQAQTELERQQDEYAYFIAFSSKEEREAMAEVADLRTQLTAAHQHADKLGGEVEEARAKLAYVHSMGLRFGMMKSSDKSEPYLMHTWTEDSDHERMFREWSASIGWETDLHRKSERVEALERGLKALIKDMPRFECHDFHHAKRDRHHEYPCPVMSRFESAIAGAKALLSTQPAPASKEPSQ